MKKIIFFFFIVTFSEYQLLLGQNIVNGSFEHAQINPQDIWYELFSGSTSIDGWKVESGSIDYIGSFWQASDGIYSIDLNGMQAGSISQSFPTMVDSTYLIKFDLAGNPNPAGFYLKRLRVSTANSFEEFTFDVTGKTKTNMGWVERIFTFTATTTETVLTFTSLNSGNSGPALDNVQVKLYYDCAGTPNGTWLIDECGICLSPSDPAFNLSCVDCAGTPNGTWLIDECGICLSPSDPAFNLSCVDCAGTPNGTWLIDECGECLSPSDSNFNLSCVDCAGTPNGTWLIDECGECLSPSDSNFNTGCEKVSFAIPTAFSPNGDGVNDEFKIFTSDDNALKIIKYEVFGRWGELLFELRNFEPTTQTDWWKGTYNEEKMPIGTYVYIIEIQKYNDAIETFVGNVTLIR